MASKASDPKPTIPIRRLGKPAAAAREIGIPVGTFWAWSSQGRLPPNAVVDFGPRAKWYDLDVLAVWREAHVGRRGSR